MSKITFKFVLGSLDQLTVDTPNDDADLDEPPNPFARKPGKTKKKASIKKKPAGRRRGTGSGNAAGSSRRRGPDGRGKEADAFTPKDDNDDAAFTPKDLQAQYDAAKTFTTFGMPHKRCRAPEAVSAFARVRRELEDSIDMVKVPGVSTKPGDEQREDTASTLSV